MIVHSRSMIKRSFDQPGFKETPLFLTSSTMINVFLRLFLVPTTMKTHYIKFLLEMPKEMFTWRVLESLKINSGLVLMLLSVSNCPESSIEQNKRANGFLRTVPKFQCLQTLNHKTREKLQFFEKQIPVVTFAFLLLGLTLNITGTFFWHSRYCSIFVMVL